MRVFVLVLRVVVGCGGVVPVSRRALGAASVFQAVPVRTDVKPSAAVALVERIYGPACVDYLSRVLLTYEEASKFWLAARRKANREALEPFRASLVLSLARNYGDARGPERLLERLSELPDFAPLAARRQLALAFSLARRQPEPLLGRLVSETENRSVASIRVVDGGSGYSDPIVSISGTATARAETRPSGKLLIRVVDGGAGYASPPPVEVSGARATAVLDRRNGSVVAIDVSVFSSRTAPAEVRVGANCTRPAKAVAELDLEVGSIEVTSGGAGYSASEPPVVFVQKGARPAVAIASLSAERYDDEPQPLLIPVPGPPFRRGGRWVFAREPPAPPFPSPAVAVREARPALGEYAAIFFCGAVSSSVSNVACVPLNVLKVKAQLNASVEASSELFVGADAIFVGYFLSGAAGFGVTSVVRNLLADAQGDLRLGSALLTVVVASLVGNALATVLGAPFEAARVRAVANDRRGWSLRNEFRLALDAIDALLARDLTFAVVQFSAFDASRNALYASYPTLKETFVAAIAASAAAGVFAGVLASLLTQPADAAFTTLATAASNKNPRQRRPALRVNHQPTEEPGEEDVVGATRALYARAGVSGLFAGAAPRALLSGANIALQCVAFEALTSGLRVNADDFAYSLDVLSTAAADLPPPAAPM